MWSGASAGGDCGDGADATDISSVVHPFPMMDRVGAAKVVELDRVGASFARG